jgi:hypothetical protein
MTEALATSHFLPWLFVATLLGCAAGAVGHRFLQRSSLNQRLEQARNESIAEGDKNGVVARARTYRATSATV